LKQFACGAVVPGCAAVLTAPDEDGILAQVAEHARDAHGIASPPPELVAQVRARITDVT
jgi:predicted small metal-binding protein